MQQQNKSRVYFSLSLSFFSLHTLLNGTDLIHCITIFHWSCAYAIQCTRIIRMETNETNFTNASKKKRISCYINFSAPLVESFATVHLRQNGKLTKLYTFWVYCTHNENKIALFIWRKKNRKENKRTNWRRRRGKFMAYFLREWLKCTVFSVEDEL